MAVNTTGSDVYHVCNRLTVQAVGSDHPHSVLQAAARLEGTSIGVDVHMTHWSLNADAEIRAASGVRVQDVDKFRIIRGETVQPIGMLKGRASRVKT